MLVVVVLLLLSACRVGGSLVIVDSVSTDTDDPYVTDDPPTDEADADTDTDADTDVTSPSGDTASMCASVPPPPSSHVSMPAIPSEEFVFDTLGLLIQADDSSNGVFTTPRGGSGTLVGPYVSSELAGTVILEDGDVAFCDEALGAVIRMDLSTGADSVLIGGIASPNSLARDEVGNVYISAYDTVLKFDPVSGSNVALWQGGGDLDGLAFSPDEAILYVNHDDAGTIYALELDADKNLLGSRVHATLPAGYSQLDGMAVDSCGFLYVIRTDGILWRIAPWGQTQQIYDQFPNGAFTSAVHFGSGAGGWPQDHLFVLDRDGFLYDLSMGVDGAPLAHLTP